MLGLSANDESLILGGNVLRLLRRAIVGKAAAAQSVTDKSLREPAQPRTTRPQPFSNFQPEDFGETAAAEAEYKL
jgi:hypothetical protein